MVNIHAGDCLLCFSLDRTSAKENRYTNTVYLLHLQKPFEIFCQYQLERASFILKNMVYSLALPE